MARNMGYPTEQEEKENASRVARAREGHLFRQLAAVIDADLLLARLMDCCSGDPMIQSKVADALIKMGLQPSRDPTSTTQHNKEQ